MNVERELPAAINSGNAKRVGEICDHLRHSQKMNYSAQIELVTSLGCSADDFEELLYEADCSDSREG